MKETTKALTSCMILEITYKLLSVTSIQVNFGRAGQKIGEKDTIFQVGGKSLMYEKRRGDSSWEPGLVCPVLALTMWPRAESQQLMVSTFTG